MEVQLGLFEAIIDLLHLDLRYIISGVVLIGILGYWMFKNHKTLPKFRIIFTSIVMYYYLCVLLGNIVGLPSIKEFIRISSFGESFFNPNINLIPIPLNGLGIDFFLNIFCFIPLGFLCPMLSKTYEEQAKKTLLLGFVLSLIIEISQLFTLYRATDINDLIANVLGTVIGYYIYKFFVKLGVVKSENYLEDTSTSCLPKMYVVLAFVLTLIDF